MFDRNAGNLGVASRFAPPSSRRVFSEVGVAAFAICLIAGSVLTALRCSTGRC